MSLSGQSFSANLAEFAKATNRTLDQTVRGVVVEIAVRLVKRSAVDTGQFRGNWQVGHDAPDTRVDSSVDKQTLGSNPHEESFTRWKDQMEDVLAGSLVYITNSLPYAHRLEYDSWSKQTPAGTVGVTLVEYGDIINSVLEAAKK